jgi:hypothetical protein
VIEGGNFHGRQMNPRGRPGTLPTSTPARACGCPARMSRVRASRRRGRSRGRAAALTCYQLLESGTRQASSVIQEGLSALPCGKGGAMATSRIRRRMSACGSRAPQDMWAGLWTRRPRARAVPMLAHVRTVD